MPDDFGKSCWWCYVRRIRCREQGALKSDNIVSVTVNIIEVVYPINEGLTITYLY